MSNLKLVLPLLIQFLSQTSDLSSRVSESTNLVREALHEELLNFAVKFFFGLILTSVIIFSLLSLGQQINIYLLSTGNGPAFSVAAFSILAVLGSVGLKFLLKPVPVAKRVSESGEAQQVSLQKLLVTLCEGLAEGYTNTVQNQQVDHTHPMKEDIAARYNQ